MARTVRDTNLETRTARLRLPIRSEPYWRGLERGFFLGYRRRGKGGSWTARRRNAGGGYTEHRIGTTDDLQDADGVAILDYGHAQRGRGTGGAPNCGGRRGMTRGRAPLQSQTPGADYLKAYERRGGKAVYETRRAAARRAYPAGVRDDSRRQADGQEDRRLAPWTCREASARTDQTGAKAKLSQGRNWS